MANILTEEELCELDVRFNNIMGEYYKIPRYLYHYTDVDGLIGIVGSGSVWATDCRFLNDSSEVSYGEELVLKVLKDRAKKEKSKIILEFMEKSQELKILLLKLFDIYVTCFCEEGNLLSLWRAYGDKGDGYSIGVDTSKIISNEYKLGKVIYKRTEQERIINSILDYHCKMLEDRFEKGNVKDIQPLIEDFSINLSVQISQVICQFKHPTFSEEKEWRLVYFRSKYCKNKDGEDDINLINFRSHNPYLIPYIMVNLNSANNQNKLPISEVILGPTSQPKLKEAALGQLLYKYGYNAKLIDSNIPFRN